MPARGLATDVEPVRVAVETGGMIVSPRDGAADLIGEHHQAAADILHPGEVGHDIMRSCGRGTSRPEPRNPSLAAAPSAAMNEDKDRCHGASGAVDVKPLDLGRSVGDALGLADPKAREFAVVDAALDQLLAVGAYAAWSYAASSAFWS